jgi:ubiquinone/menaquinone biosynthesis C-methylase UbiE
MKNIKDGYDIWSDQYDTNENKTRDLEHIALRATLSGIHFDHCLEIGCGTGKNTEWIISKATHITAVDLSDGMLAKAKNKIQSEKVKFIQADINAEWDFVQNEKFDLATFSLVLEHIENLDAVFEKLNPLLNNNASVYIGELHPFKQYSGTKARFHTEDGVKVLNCFNHHVTDFINAGKKNAFQIVDIDEYFDNNDRSTIPRILTLLFRKQ